MIFDILITRNIYILQNCFQKIVFITFVVNEIIWNAKTNDMSVLSSFDATQLILESPLHFL